MLEDIVLQDVSSTVYEPDTDVDLPGWPQMCLVRIPCHFFLTPRKNRGRYRYNSFEGILSTFRCSPRVDFLQVRVFSFVYFDFSCSLRIRMSQNQMLL